MHALSVVKGMKLKMKKEEAMQIAQERSRVLCEYISQILSDPQKVEGEIRINSTKIDKERMLTFDIRVPSKNFERHLNTGISVQHVDVLTGQILDDFIDHFLESEAIGCTRYYRIRGGYGMNIDGITAINSMGSQVRINFVCRGNNFDEQIETYNAKLDEYVHQQNSSSKRK